MKLQVNTAGAWKDVCDVPIDRYAEVRAAAVALGDIMGRSARFCIVDDAGKREWLDAQARANRARVQSA